jgi:1,4-alpha-glucan branching enzyme
MLKKRKFKDKVRVTFIFPAYEGEGKLCLVGDFNGWDQQARPMSRNREGDWETTLDFEPNQQYEYRYLADDRTWHNDPEPDAFVRNPYGSQNSLVITTVAHAGKAGARPKGRNRKQPPSG